MEALRVKGLSKSFVGLQVLHEVSFSVEIGERVAVIGPNGAGKTSLINVLSGLLPATSGEIHILGQEITRLPQHSRVRLGLARSFQLNTLFPNLTLLENVLLAVQGTRRSHLRMFKPVTAYDRLFAETRELLEEAGLGERRDVPVSSLSYGEQRQVEMVLALASRPKVLLLDEPSAGLSSAEISTLINLTRNLPRETAVLFSAHDMDVVFALADRVMVLYYGQIIAQGTPKEIQADTRVREIYLGTEGAEIA